MNLQVKPVKGESMPLYDFTCNKCGFTDEYLLKQSETDKDVLDEKCPECKEGNMNRQHANRISFDVLGGYEYQYGKKNWKKGKSVAERADVLNGNADPY